jgi:23S rRNA pseudouridine2605 synthase
MPHNLPGKPGRKGSRAGGGSGNKHAAQGRTIERPAKALKAAGRFKGRDEVPKAAGRFKGRDEAPKAMGRFKGRDEAPKAMGRFKSRDEAPKAGARFKSRDEAPKAGARFKSRDEAPKAGARFKSRDEAPKAGARFKSRDEAPKAWARFKSRDEAPKAGARFKGRDEVSQPRGPGARSGGAMPRAMESDPREPERISKIMARAGACSRRDAERWIAEGRVALNGEILKDPAVNVSGSDRIIVDGAPLARRARTRLFLFHKPRGLVSTEHDPEGRPTVFDYLRDHWPDGPRVVSVGRLDINTEGLLLLTNDGGLARVLELPATGWARRYRVRANGETDQARLDQLREGLTLDGVTYAGIEAVLDRQQGANCWLTMALREGKNREIKRVLEHIGLAVNRLIRISFGPFQLGELAEGAVDEVRTRVLRDQLGPSLAEAAGVDFESPMSDAMSDEPEPAARGGRSAHRGPGEAAPRAGDQHHSPPRGAAGGRGAHGGRGEAVPRAGDQRHSPGGAARPRKDDLDMRQPQADAKKAVSRVRKHVSVLRREGAGMTGAPRKRIEKAETADRSGRVVPVERLVPVGPRSEVERPRTRNGRRFEAEREQRADAGGKIGRGFAHKAGKAAPGSRPPRENSKPGRGNSQGPKRPGSAQEKGAGRPRSTWQGPKPGGGGARSPGGRPRGKT